MVLIDQIYQFKHGEFMRSIQRDTAAGERFKDAADDTSRRMMQIADYACPSKFCLKILLRLGSTRCTETACELIFRI